MDWVRGRATNGVLGRMLGRILGVRDRTLRRTMDGVRSLALDWALNVFVSPWLLGPLVRLLGKLYRLLCCVLNIGLPLGWLNKLLLWLGQLLGRLRWNNGSLVAQLLSRMSWLRWLGWLLLLWLVLTRSWDCSRKRQEHARHIISAIAARLNRRLGLLGRLDSDWWRRYMLLRLWGLPGLRQILVARRGVGSLLLRELNRRTLRDTAGGRAVGRSMRTLGWGCRCLWDERVSGLILRVLR